MMLIHAGIKILYCRFAIIIISVLFGICFCANLPLWKATFNTTVTNAFNVVGTYKAVEVQLRIYYYLTGQNFRNYLVRVYISMLSYSYLTLYKINIRVWTDGTFRHLCIKNWHMHTHTHIYSGMEAHNVALIQWIALPLIAAFAETKIDATAISNSTF